MTHTRPWSLQPAKESVVRWLVGLYINPNDFRACGTTLSGVSENVVYPIVPNGFADHYPVFKWLAIIGKINPTFSDKPIDTPTFSRLHPHLPPFFHRRWSHQKIVRCATQSVVMKTQRHAFLLLVPLYIYIYIPYISQNCLNWKHHMKTYRKRLYFEGEIHGFNLSFPL